MNRFLERSWQRGWWPEPSLDPDALEREACRRERVSEIPGRRWREPFRLLLADLQGPAALSPLGRQIANGQLVGLLRARVRAERLIQYQSEVLCRPIRAPVVILGQMRSGTTRMHRLLACDPRFARTRLFESLEPVPFGAGPDRRLLQAVAVQAFLHKANPALRHIHPTAPLKVEEEFGLHSFSFHGAQFEVQWNVPGFSSYVEQADATPAYAEFRTLVQIMGWSRREEAGKTWLLKSPQFTADPDALLRAFPDARLICLHREAEQVVASSASLVWHQRRIHSEQVCKAEIGRQWLRKTGLRADRTRRFLAATSVPRLEVGYDEVSRDWQAAVRRIYAFLELDLPGDVLRRMTRCMASGDHRGHGYTLEEFGLSVADVERTFAAPKQAA